MCEWSCCFHQKDNEGFNQQWYWSDNAIWIKLDSPSHLQGNEQGRISGGFTLYTEIVLSSKCVCVRVCHSRCAMLPTFFIWWNSNLVIWHATTYHRFIKKWPVATMLWNIRAYAVTIILHWTYSNNQTKRTLEKQTNPRFNQVQPTYLYIRQESSHAKPNSWKVPQKPVCPMKRATKNLLVNWSGSPDGLCRLQLVKNVL